MKKTLIIITAVIACIIVAIAGLILAYTRSSDYTADHLPQKTSINGIDCSNLTYDEAFSQLSDEWNKKTLTVVGSLNDKLAEFTHFDCTYDIAGQIRSIKEKHLLTAAMSHYLHTPFSVKIPMTVKTCGDSFKEQVMNSEFLNNPNAKASTDAYVDLSDPDFPIVPEKMGTAIDKDRFFQAMLEQIQSGNLQMIYDEKKYNDIPKVTSDDENLIKYQEFCKKYLGQKIDYELGEDSFTVSPEELSTMFDSSLSGKASTEGVKEYVKQLAEKYNTVGIERTFETLAGKKITVKGGTYGWKIDQEKEAEQLTKDLESHKDVKREPIYSKKGYGTYSRLLGNTYADVEFSRQEVRFYRDGVLKFSCSVVTGNQARGDATPTGTYFIMNKLRNVILKGDDYESPVSYWMGITPTGIGFHDASWRSSFGGSIWRTNGSHGCVNMPTGRIPEFYRQAEVGMPVVMHY